MPETRKETVSLPAQVRSGSVRADSINVDARTVDIVWSTGAEVLRQDWRTGKRYKESLSLDPSHVRMDRLNGGAPVLDTHDTWSLGAVIGVVETASVDGKEGRATVRFARTPEVDPIWSKVEQGIVRNVSVGYRVHTYEKTEREDGPDEWRATDWEPMELSFVPVGVDAGAGVRSERPDTYPCTIIRALPEQSGNSKENTMPEAVDAGQTPAPTEAVRVEDTTATTTETRATEKPAAASFKDVTAYVRSVGLDTEYRDALFEKVEAEGLTIEAVRAQIFDDLAEKGDNVQTNNHVRVNRDETDTTRSLVANAIMHRANPVEIKLEDGARPYMGRSLMEIGEALLIAGGVRTAGLDKMQRAGLMLGLDYRSGGMHTTSDFPFILADVANKTLRAAYAKAPRTFLPIARRTSLPDFKTINRVQLGEAPKMKVVNEHGEFGYGTIGEGREQYKLATYGRIVALTRQAIINDDLSAFTRIPGMMGNAAANLESDIVWGIITGNAAMGDGNNLFSAAHNNWVDSGAVPDATTIGALMKLIGEQTGLDSDDTTYLNLQGRYIVGGWDTDAARRQYTSAGYMPTSQGGINIYSNMLEVITEARLTGKPWYIFCSPDQIDTIEYAYLDGQEGVYLETRTGFDVDGIEIKARHDFAAKAIDWRGMAKNDGE